MSGVLVLFWAGREINRIIQVLFLFRRVFGERKKNRRRRIGGCEGGVCTVNPIATVYLPAYILNYSPTSLPTYKPAYLQIHRLSHKTIDLHAYVETYLPTYKYTYISIH